MASVNNAVTEATLKQIKNDREAADTVIKAILTQIKQFLEKREKVDHDHMNLLVSPSRQTEKKNDYHVHHNLLNH
jgi:hypothetical protein